ncbi:recombinase family protein [Sanguibacter sp. 25GB23B1]|uniref:recombinase family protein n=1 Tax=unclassified Sanguibacter TaxID=2645534 RepID=UPI0032AFF538
MLPEVSSPRRSTIALTLPWGTDIDSTHHSRQRRCLQKQQASARCSTSLTRNWLMLNMLATLAEYERELIVERVNAGIAAARQNGTRFGRPLSDPAAIADKLQVDTDARARGRTAQDAARLVGWSRATLYRHQQAGTARASAQM